MNKLDELIKQRDALTNKIGVIRANNFVEANEPYVGRYFKFMNGYDGSNIWPLYIKVCSIDEDGQLTSVEFEQTCDGDVSIKTNEYFDFDGHCEEIDVNEYSRAWIELSEQFHRMGQK